MKQKNSISEESNKKLDELKNKIEFEEQYDKGLAELNRNRRIVREYFEEKERKKIFIKKF